jgi:hypothetical protein
MKTYQLINLSPLKLHYKSLGGLPSSLTRESDPPQTPEGYAYVENFSLPEEAAPEGQRYVRELTTESYGWKLEVSPVQVINQVTNYQIKQALNTVPADRAAVDAFVAGSEDQNVIDGWAHAAIFKRDNPLFLGAVAYLGWSQEKVDGYLELAATFD